MSKDNFFESVFRRIMERNGDQIEQDAREKQQNGRRGMFSIVYETISAAMIPRQKLLPWIPLELLQECHQIDPEVFGEEVLQSVQTYQPTKEFIMSIMVRVTDSGDLTSVDGQYCIFKLPFLSPSRSALTFPDYATPEQVKRLVQRTSEYNKCDICHFAPVHGTTFQCQGCKVPHYCSRKCQYLHWEQGHRNTCVQMCTARTALSHTFRQRYFGPASSSSASSSSMRTTVAAKTSTYTDVVLVMHTELGNLELMSGKSAAMQYGHNGGRKSCMFFPSASSSPTRMDLGITKPLASSTITNENILELVQHCPHLSVCLETTLKGSVVVFIQDPTTETSRSLVGQDPQNPTMGVRRDTGQQITPATYKNLVLQWVHAWNREYGSLVELQECIALRPGLLQKSVQYVVGNKPPMLVTSITSFKNFCRACGKWGNLRKCPDCCGAFLCVGTNCRKDHHKCSGLNKKFYHFPASNTDLQDVQSPRCCNKKCEQPALIVCDENRCNFGFCSRECANSESHEPYCARKKPEEDIHILQVRYYHDFLKKKTRKKKKKKKNQTPTVIDASKEKKEPEKGVVEEQSCFICLDIDSSAPMQAKPWCNNHHETEVMHAHCLKDYITMSHSNNCPLCRGQLL